VHSLKLVTVNPMNWHLQMRLFMCKTPKWHTALHVQKQKRHTVPIKVSGHSGRTQPKDIRTELAKCLQRGEECISLR